MSIECDVFVTKTCADCQQDKPLGEFRARKDSKTARFNTCKRCENKTRRANTELYQQALARQRDYRAAERDKLSISAEITALIQATTARRTTTPAPLPTREELAAWYRQGCRI
jgi:NAD-dependent SIR2 family protein deacetylase